jgi:two-component system sensor histidine kinase YesM
MLCLILIVGCSFLSNRTFYSNITRRILQLAHACENLTLENVPKTGGQDDSGNSHLMLKQQLTVPVLGEDEIGRLSVSINNMLTRITELTDQNEQEVMAAQKAAYDMLAAQIHPHFIYNTLENLRMMAEMNDDEQVADLLYALGKMLRLSITDATSTGELSMEIEHAQMYLKLQQMRLNDKLSYVIEPVSPEIIHTECPRFLLQPLVENAIKHGFQQKKTPGNIIISSGVYEHGIYLRVWDDGIGFSTERLQQIQQELRREHPVSPDSHGIGLLNVHSRLRMFYGPGAGLTIESVPQQGTTCTLWLANH